MADEGFKRKLAAILSADVEGYSRLMDDDEEATVHTLTSYRTAITDFVQQFRGCIVDTPGDNILADFTSVVDAVNCAVEIQRELVERNAELPANRKMQFRIGVNLGDVIDEDGRIYGDGVNIAARVESLAEAGGICISGRTHDQVENKLGLEYEDLGKHEVKNISRPIQVYRVLSFPGAAAHRVVQAKRKLGKKWLWATAFGIALLLFVFIGLYWKYFYLPTPENIDQKANLTFDLPKGPSIAVLPFDNMSGNPDQDYICDGITENIIYALSHVQGLFVIARNSTFAYKGKSTNVQQIGKELGVQYLMEGSIKKYDELIRVTVQLVETKTGNNIWSDVYDRKMVDIFQLQDEIAIQICEAMQIHITEGETFRNRYKGIKDVRIAMKILKAIEYLRYYQSPESITIGLRMAEEVIEMDSEIQIAHGLVGMYNLYAIETGVCENQIICLAKATEAARKALSFDENNSDIHILTAYLFLMRRQHENAIQAAKKAILLNPNNADAYLLLGVVLTYSGCPNEGVAFIKKAIRIDPFPPVIYLFQLGVSYQESKQLRKAIEIYKDIIKREPDFRGAHIRMAGAYSFLGEEDKAKKAASEVLKIDPNFNLKGFVSKLPYKNKADNERYVDALRKAGLPE
jgi:TolB-like protein/class 3 adenylate cyclase